MNYIKAKYTNKGVPSLRSYTFRCNEDVKAGDILTTSDGNHVMATDESVDMEWVEAYGAEKISVVRKVEVDADAKAESV